MRSPRRFGLIAAQLATNHIHGTIPVNPMHPDDLRKYDCPTHIRFSQRVQELEKSDDPEDHRLYLAVLVYVLETNVHDDWPRLSERRDSWLGFVSGDGRPARVRVRAIGQLKLIREAQWVEGVDL